MTVGAEVLDESVVFNVSDNGIGISEELINNILEPLFTTKSKGIGLGLAIAKNLIEANSGSIEVESTVGMGSTFILKLPIDKP